MRKYGLEILLIFIILFFQLLFGEYINIRGLKPDILLIFIVSFAISHSHRESVIIGGIGGLVEDLFSGDVLGFFLLPRALISYLLSYIKESNIIKGYANLSLPIAIFFASFAVYEIEFVFANILKIGTYSHIAILKSSFVNFLFTPLSYVFIFLIKKTEGER